MDVDSGGNNDLNTMVDHIREFMKKNSVSVDAVSHMSGAHTFVAIRVPRKPKLNLREKEQTVSKSGGLSATSNASGSSRPNVKQHHSIPTMHTIVSENPSSPMQNSPLQAATIEEVARLFDVSLDSIKEIDEFVDDLQGIKVETWSLMSNEQLRVVIDILCKRQAELKNVELNARFKTNGLSSKGLDTYSVFHLFPDDDIVRSASFGESLPSGITMNPSTMNCNETMSGNMDFNTSLDQNLDVEEVAWSTGYAEKSIEFATRICDLFPSVSEVMNSTSNGNSLKPELIKPTIPISSTIDSMAEPETIHATEVHVDSIK